MLVIGSVDQAKRLRPVRTVIAITSLLLVMTSAFGQKPPSREEFEVTSVKRDISESRPWLVPPVGGRFTATNVSLKLLIGVGWPQKVVGGPSWIATDGYDVSAVMPKAGASTDDFKLMVQNMLRDRFALKTHVETRETVVYALVPAKDGMKLPDVDADACISGSRVQDGESHAGCGAMNVTTTSIMNQKISMQWFTSVLGVVLGRPVVNKTGFTRSFQVGLEFAPLAPDANSVEPSIFEALEKQLGLRLESQKGSEDVLVIDHVERPSEN